MEHDATYSLSSTSPRSFKRSRSPTSPSSAEKKRRFSCNDGTMRDTTPHITTEIQQDENRPAQEKKDPKVLNKCRDEAKNMTTTVLPTHKLTVEMAKLVQHYDLWQDKLARWSRELARKVTTSEIQQVKHVLTDLVTTVEIQTLQDQLQTQEMDLKWALWLENDAADCLQELYQDIQDTSGFEAMEKQLMDDRVVELETQLAQKRAVEKEKEKELSLLRADEEQLMYSSRQVVLHTELKTLGTGKEKAMDVEIKQLNEKIKHLTHDLMCVTKERAVCKLQNQKLMDQVCQLREEQETREVKTLQQEEDIKKLHAMLHAAKTREEKTTAALEMAEEIMEKSKERKDELEILYAKFRSSMDAVSEKTMRLEELEHELKDAQIIRNRNEQLEKQVAQLQQEKAELSVARNCEKNDMNEELVVAQQQLAELRELAAQQKELASKLQSEVMVLKDENKVLRKQHVKQEKCQSVGRPSKECDKQHTEIDNDLVVQVAEKEALQMFVQRYHSAAEEKCSRLLEKVSELELKFKRTQARAD